MSTAPMDWDVCAAAEKVVSKVDLLQATTSEHVYNSVRTAVANKLQCAVNEIPCSAEDSVTACGGKRTVVRACIGLLLSSQTDIDTSPLLCRQACGQPVRRAYPGGPNELDVTLTSSSD